MLGVKGNISAKHLRPSYNNDQNVKSKYSVYTAAPQILKVLQNFPENG